MKLKKLREIIKDLPTSLDDAEVVMSSDAEGNRYSPLSDLSTDAAYVPESTYSGDVFYARHGVDGNCLESQEELDNLMKNFPAIVLHPVN